LKSNINYSKLNLNAWTPTHGKLEELQTLRWRHEK
jgi:hypothetical protein